MILIVVTVVFMVLKALDVVGCDSGEGTRSCTAHEVCGETLAVDDLVVIRLEVVRNTGNKLEEALKVYRFVGIDQACHVGFLERRCLHKKGELKDKTAMVVEDYRISPSASKRYRSNRMLGIVKVVLLDHIEEYNRS